MKIISLIFLISLITTNAVKLNKKQKEILKKVKNDDEITLDPYLGGFNSD